MDSKDSSHCNESIKIPNPTESFNKQFEYFINLIKLLLCDSACTMFIILYYVCLHTQASNKDSKVFISLQRSDLK